MAEYIEREAVVEEMKKHKRAGILIVLDAPAADVVQVRQMKYERISKRAKAGAHPVVLHVDCEAKCEPIFKRCEYCDLEKELLNRLADLEDKIENGTLVFAENPPQKGKQSEKVDQ